MALLEPHGICFQRFERIAFADPHSKRDSCTREGDEGLTSTMVADEVQKTGGERRGRPAPAYDLPGPIA
jgi:hypothetical protein